MKKKYVSLLICTITLLFLIEFFNHTELVFQAFFDGTNLWFKNLLPTIFPFFIITDILNNYHLTDYFSLMLGNFLQKVFKLPKSTAYVLVMSIISGFPSNSKFIKELLDTQEINNKQATKLLTMTHFSNPLFIVGTIGISFLEDKRLGIIILIIHYLTNLLVGFLFRNIYIEKIEKNIKKERVTLPFISLLKSSILNTINALFIIYGIIIFFAITTVIINENLHLSGLEQTLLNGILEMTGGLKLLSNLSLDKVIKATIATFFISFGGLSIHMQVMSILSEYKINYFIYLISRIMHASIASLLVFIILTYH